MSLARRKITLVGENAAAFVLVSNANIADIVLVGGDAEGIARARAGDWSDVSGSDVVAVLDGTTPGAELLRHCPDAVILVAAPDPAGACRAILEATHLPRGRVLGIAGPGPVSVANKVADVIAAILLDRREEHHAVVLCDGERGEAGMVEVPVCVGAGGVEAIL